MLFQVIVGIGVVSIVLALALVYLFFKVYRLEQSTFLLGLPFGFLFLAVSYIFLGVHLAYTSVDTFSSSLMWLRVVTQTWGYALIAASYFLSTRSQKGTGRNLFAISVLSFVSIFFAFGLLLIFNPAGLSVVYSANELFTVTNLCLIGYIIFFLVRKLELANGGVSGLTSAPLAFAFLWIGEFSYLLWEFDRGMAALVGSQIARVIALVLFIRIYYLTSKGLPALDSKQAE